MMLRQGVKILCKNKMSNIIQILLILFGVAATYLLASVSSAILVCRLFKLPDPRQSGSHNPGATNVLRIGGKLPGVLTLIGDVLKGFLPTLIIHFLFNDSFISSVIVLSAFLGHCYPIYYQFQGGKGVATTFGALFALSLPVAIGCGFIWVLCAATTRYVSLASILSLSAMPIIVLFYESPLSALPLALISLLLIYRHRANINRLWQGAEPKLGVKK